MNGQSMEKIEFGGSVWLVLERTADKLLLLSEDIVKIKPYDSDFDDEIWATSAVRRYLNGAFLETFSKEAQARIVSTTVHNPDNPWYETEGGEDTEDRIFLLSVAEAVRYFDKDNTAAWDREYDIADDGMTEVTRDGRGGFYSDPNDAARCASYHGIPACWWLRSPGSSSQSAAFVYENGAVGIVGLDLHAMMDVGGVGVRPAMWVRL